MVTKEETCKERLPAHLAGRMETLGALVKGYEVRDQDDLDALTDDDVTEIVNIYDPAEARKEANDNTPDGVNERCAESLQQLALCVESKRMIDVCISTGGPEDRFEFWLDEDGRPERIWYIFKDWFDGARQELEGEQFEIAAQAAEIAGWIEFAQ